MREIYFSAMMASFNLNPHCKRQLNPTHWTFKSNYHTNMQVNNNVYYTKKWGQVNSSNKHLVDSKVQFQKYSVRIMETYEQLTY